MTAAEYAGWSEHLTRFPLGDPYTQTLLARLVASFETFAGGKMVAVRDIAPWLPEPVETQEAAEAAKEARRESLAARAKQVAVLFEAGATEA